MKIFLITAATMALAGCVAASREQRLTEVVAVAQAFEEVVPLEVMKPTPNFYLARLEIVQPRELRGALIEVVCERSLPKANLLRAIGTRLSLSVADLQLHRGSSQLGDGPSRVLYYFDFTELKSISMAEEKPNQALEPTPTAGTSAAEQPLVPAAVVAHL